VHLEVARRRIEDNADINAFISLTEEVGSGDVVAVKDMVAVKGSVTTGGGTLRPRTPDEKDAAVIHCLRLHGCVVVGKTNLHEWALGPTSVNPHYGPVRHPADRSRVAGGSSGGSAAAVAAGMCDWAVGTDTGGSIRIPAGLCGVFGMKPTTGLISTEGVIPLSPTMDTVGPLAPSLKALARALEFMGGPSVPVSQPQWKDAPRLAVPKDWIADLDESTRQLWDAISAGLPILSLPARAQLAAVGQTILVKEAADFHRRWMESAPEQYGRDVLALLRMGASVSRGEYRAALQTQRRLAAEVAAAMDDWDALILPTTACVAPRIGDANVREPLTRFTRAFNVTGQPAVSLPGPASGLPVGIQLVGHHGADAHLLQVAHWVVKGWRLARSDKAQVATTRGSG